MKNFVKKWSRLFQVESVMVKLGCNRKTGRTVSYKLRKLWFGTKTTTFCFFVNCNGLFQCHAGNPRHSWFAVYGFDYQHFQFHSSKLVQAGFS